MSPPPRLGKSDSRRTDATPHGQQHNVHKVYALQLLFSYSTVLRFLIYYNLSISCTIGWLILEGVAVDGSVEERVQKRIRRLFERQNKFQNMPPLALNGKKWDVESVFPLV